MSNFVPDYGKIQLERPRRDAAGEYELGLDVAPCQGCYGWRCGHAVCAHRFAHFRRDGAVLGSVAVSKPEHVPPRGMLRLFAASLLAIVFNQGSFIFGVKLSSPADASIITTSMPLWAMLLAAVFLREPVTGKKVAGIAFGAGGALMLILGSGATATVAGAHPILGDLLVLFAQLSYATYLVLFKNFICRYSLVTVMKWMFTYAFLCTLPFSYSSLVATDWLALGWDDVLAVAFIVVFATFVSYIFIIVGQKNLRPTVAGMYNYVQPVVACVVTVCLGLDSFNVMKGLAVAMIFVGVFLVTTSKSRADECREARR